MTKYWESSEANIISSQKQGKIIIVFKNFF